MVVANEECLGGYSREQKSPSRGCTFKHHYIRNASPVPWTDRVNHERSLGFRAWFSWDRSRERENLGERCQRFVPRRVPLVDTFTFLFFFSRSISSLSSIPFSFILILSCSSVSPSSRFYHRNPKMGKHPAIKFSTRHNRFLKRHPVYSFVVLI